MARIGLLIVGTSGSSVGNDVRDANEKRDRDRIAFLRTMMLRHVESVS